MAGIFFSCQAKNFLTIFRGGKPKKIEAIRTAGSKAEAGNFVALLVGHKKLIYNSRLRGCASRL